MKKRKAYYYSNLFDKVDTAAAYCMETTEKDIRNKKSKQTSPPIKEDDGNLKTDDTEKAAMSNDYLCTVDEKLIGPADEIQPLHSHSRQNVDIPTTTSITISQMEIEKKICKLKVKKAAGPDDVCGYSIAPSLTRLFKHSVDTCKPPDQWKIARVSAAFKKDEGKTLHDTDYYLSSGYQVN